MRLLVSLKMGGVSPVRSCSRLKHFWRNTLFLMLGASSLLLDIPASHSDECKRAVSTLSEAKDYADCLDKSFSSTRDVLVDRISALETELQQMKSSFSTVDLKAQNLTVEGTLHSSNDFRIGNAARWSSHYLIGPSDAGGAPWKSIGGPITPPKRGGEFIGWVDLYCIHRDGGGVGRYQGSIGAGDPPKFYMDPALQPYIRWQNGGLEALASRYQDCLLNLYSSISP